MSTDAAKADGPRYALLLATASLGIILVPLNSTMLAVALPDIRAEFSVGHNQVAWLFSAYLIAMAVAQPLGGRIGDQIGQTRALQIGFLAFLAISLTAAAAPQPSITDRGPHGTGSHGRPDRTQRPGDHPR